LAVALKPYLACLEKKHLPLVIIGNVRLIWTNGLEQREVLDAILHLIELGPDHIVVLLQYSSHREVSVMKINPISQLRKLPEKRSESFLNHPTIDFDQ
jgi:hypothetical protein